MRVDPNFFIVGAPKSGTTALYEYLRAHADVFMPEYKEPHYYAPDLESTRYLRDPERYESLFLPGAECKRVGEASVYYLYSEEAAERIHAAHPEASIIIMLRNPTDMIYSLHSQRLFSGHEDIADFAEALAAEPARHRGERIPPNADPVKCLFYSKLGLYSEQVGRYLDRFGEDRVKVILYDDFAADTPSVFREVCAFLGVAEIDIAGRRHNPNKQIRSEALRNAMKFSPVIKQVVRALLPRGTRQRIAKKVVQMNTDYVQRAPLDLGVRRQLDAKFRADVDDLSARIGRDLSTWANSHEEPERRTA